ncbi:MAG: hypothetical protein JNK69_06235 [Saprospiraceae bacterium]|nr:hypothetical protein [Candidatus Vicinibacter proximus]MBL7822987.1 hypothetical protein [Saprospiraceae bacterium]MCC6842810.1 hypothetical protein [Saprospiraceae bacterium]HRG34262.1 hypothetical protein [Saprospiraceae bacterium]
MERYESEPIRLYDLMNEFAVHCPKCQGRAIVSVGQVFDFKNAMLKCTACHFSEAGKDRMRYIVSSKAKCRHCLEWLVMDIAERKSIPKYVNVTCGNCNTLNRISENWESYQLKYNPSGILDPAFGLPLWYSGSVKGEIIWAYNQKHLLEIENYVRATLRERTTDRFKMTMVEKLPDFIKSAKNRDEVLKALDRMKNKL